MGKEAYVVWISIASSRFFEMHISEVRVNNFLSYKVEQKASELSPHVNVVVGRNGSGKSNFFHAIRFVLSGVEQASMEELRYSGPGFNFDNATVDIVFSDAAERFVNLGNEVTITREVVNTNSRYLVNGKQVTKRRIRSILDVAGLALGANNLYIVPQGEVNQLATATDLQRLDKLLAFSGATTFDNRKQEAQEMLERSSHHIRDVDSHLKLIMGNLESFKRDMDKLDEFLVVESKLTGAKYCCLKLQIRKSDLTAELGRKEIDELDSKVGEQVYKSITDLQTQIMEQKVAILKDEGEYDQQLLDCKALKAALDSKLAERALLELTLEEKRNMPDSQSQSRINSAGSDAEPDTLPATQADMDITKEQLDSDQETLSQLKQKLDVANSQIRALKLKQGRFDKLNDEESRIQQEKYVAELQSSLKSAETSSERADNMLVKLNEDLESKVNLLDSARSELVNVSKAYDSSMISERDAREESTALERERNLAYQNSRKAEISSASYIEIAEEQSAGLTFARSSMVSGVKEVLGAVDALNISSEQYFGTVANVLQVEPTVLNAVICIAGARLLYQIVDTSSVGESLVEAVKNSNTRADVTIMALDTLIASKPVPPTTESEVEWASPLSSFITVEPKFQKVVDLLFGKYMLCDTLEHAYDYARKYKVPTVTLEGEVCDPRGSMTGGSLAADSNTNSSSLSRIEQITKYVEFVKKSYSEKHESASFKDMGELATQKILKNSTLLRKLEYERINQSYRKKDCEDKVIEIEDTIQRLHTEIDEIKDQKSRFINDIEVTKSELEFLKNKDNFSGEFTQSDSQQLTQMEQDYQNLYNQFDVLKTRYDANTKKLSRQRKFMQGIRRSFVSMDIDEEDFERPTSAGQSLGNVSFMSSQVNQGSTLENLRDEINEMTEEYERLEKILENKESQLFQMRDELNQQTEECSYLENRARMTFNSKKKLSKKLLAIQAFKEEAERELKKLGTVPEQALSDVQNVDEMSKNEVNSLLSRYSKLQTELDIDLNSFDVVNRKAGEQYSSYERQFEELEQRKAALSREKAELTYAMEQLEAAKQERVDKLMAKLQDIFPEVYRKLSGNSDAGLILHRENETGKYVGIGVRMPNGFTTTQLSGGQKTISALALIFSMQACDPAPFYIFDEIDANLDSSSRLLIAKAIKEMSTTFKSQYICTTFGAELVEIADKCYGVSYHDHQSSVMEIDKQLAKDFVDNREFF